MKADDNPKVKPNHLNRILLGVCNIYENLSSLVTADRTKLHFSDQFDAIKAGWNIIINGWAQN